MNEDLKPRNGAAPVHLLPARALRAVSAVFKYGADKYNAWGWSNPKTKEDYKEVYGGAAMRHLMKWLDPNESDNDDWPGGSGLPHLTMACTNLLIAIHHAGLDYVSAPKPADLKAVFVDNEFVQINQIDDAKPFVNRRVFIHCPTHFAHDWGSAFVTSANERAVNFRNLVTGSLVRIDFNQQTTMLKLAE